VIPYLDFGSANLFCNLASAFIRDCILPSPPSTVLLSRKRLSQMKDTFVQRSAVIQILRFVSPNPWGSRAAEGFRKSDSLNRIIFALFDNASDGSLVETTAFSAGSHVLWSPVYVRPDGQIKHTKPIPGAGGWTEGWLASRSPPYKITGSATELETDITPLIIGEKSLADPIGMLYDNRFVLTLHPWEIPTEVLERFRASPTSGCRLLVTATKKYFLPRLTFRLSSGDMIEDIETGGSESGPNMSGSSGTFAGADWAHWKLARSFE